MRCFVGVDRSFFNFVISEVCDGSSAIDAMREFIKRGGRPLPCTWDCTNPLETVVRTQCFAGDELLYIVKVSHNEVAT